MTLFFACAGEDAGVCGDGARGPGEACDAAGDGCDDACHLTGTTAWTVIRSDPDTAVSILDVAVGASGRIAVLGVTSDTSEYGAPWLLALDPAGAELWRVELPAQGLGPFPLHVAVDADDGVYFQGVAVHAFDSRGRSAWDLAPEDAGFLGLAVADDAVFLASSRGFSTSGTFGLRRVDPATGESVWEWTVDDDGKIYIPAALTVAGDDLVALSYRQASPADDADPVLVAVDTGSGESSAVIVGNPEEIWTAVVGLHAGDVVITGQLEDAWFVRRLGLDGQARWTTPLDFHGSGLADVASGPDDSIIVVGDSRGPDDASVVLQGLVRALSADGAPAWDVAYAPESPWGFVTARAAAFGPGFLVIGGRSSDGQSKPAGWIRRIGPK